MAKQTLIEKSPSLLPALCCFQTQSTPFPGSMFSTMCVQNLNPTVWWDCVKKTGDGVPAELCDLASLLLKLPASSASIERIFSNFGNVQSKLRNRLGIDKAAKLVTCYRSLRGANDIGW